MGIRSKIALLLNLTLLSACGSAVRRPTPGRSLPKGESIVGGELAGEEDVFTKSIVGVLDVNQGALCTGSLISPTTVVTAAHCVTSEKALGRGNFRVNPVSPDDIEVRFGFDVMNSESFEYRRVASITVHPSYFSNSGEQKNTGDIAILRFEGGVPTGYKAALLLREASNLTNAQPVRLAGYGIANVRRHTGDGVLRYTDVIIHDSAFSESEILLDQTDGHGACHGDSGGPAYVVQNGRYRLWGITSRGVNDPRDTCKGYAAYTSIVHYLPWIRGATTR